MEVPINIYRKNSYFRLEMNAEFFENLIDYVSITIKTA